MLPDHIIAREKIADIAKGRYNKQQVAEMFQEVARVAAIEGEEIGFEYGILSLCQSLHYDKKKFGFGAKRLAYLMEITQPALDAFDAKAYDMEDMRQALREDAKFDLEIIIRRKNKNA